jgi:teichuronic acid biosynthesis glycosyltransferase TuaC
MKVLIVCSGNGEVIAPFVEEQANSLKSLGVDIDYFLIMGKGYFGYLRNFPALIRKIKSYNPTIIHAHYGLSGMLAVLQRFVPVIITFHGSDIYNGGLEKAISMLAFKFSKYNIFVGKKLATVAGVKYNYSIISCGVDMDTSVPLEKEECRKILGLNLSDKYVLFPSSFDIPVKNYKLAQLALRKLENVKVLELKGYSREEVNLLMNASDLLLVTSKNEGGPLVIKEALACGCPVVSTDVGDAKEVIGNLDGCYITGFSAFEISTKIRLILNSGERIESRNRIYELKLDTESVAKRILSIYNEILES